MSARPEAAFVLLVLQSLFWFIAGVSAVPFGIAGERSMFALALVSFLVALGGTFVALGLVWRRRWARRVALGLEGLCIAGALILFAIPIGANHGLVAWMVNLALPVAVVVLLRKTP